MFIGVGELCVVIEVQVVLVCLWVVKYAKGEMRFCFQLFGNNNS